MSTNSWAPVAILVFSYVAFSIGRVPWLRAGRLAAAFIGGALMVTVGGLSLEKAQLAVGWWPVLKCLAGSGQKLRSTA